MDFDAGVLESVVERSLGTDEVALGGWCAEELFAGRWAGARGLPVYVRRGGRHHLWLEDLGRDDSPWSLSDYAHAPRQLGRFNGAYLEQRPLPAGEWLSRDWLRSWLAGRRRRDRRAAAPPQPPDRAPRVSAPPLH